MDGEAFDCLTGEFARIARIHQNTVRLYCQLRLLEFRKLSNGAMALRRGDAKRARELCRERLARRWHPAE
ncbi:MAG TPA: hypothetical protein VGH84_10700 [Steroidobacteraceae bacterium]|jgi:hypothetical protein